MKEKIRREEGRKQGSKKGRRKAKEKGRKQNSRVVRVEGRVDESEIKGRKKIKHHVRQNDWRSQDIGLKNSDKNDESVAIIVIEGRQKKS